NSSLIYPRCHFYSFYTKIDLSENFATEPKYPWWSKYVHDRWWIRMDLHVWTTVCSRRLNKVRSQI
ncbi:hypothetical protein, partial [Lactococcus cremoris]|uniref:hypothetical protein n=1 Tax=Lactococcus lactis subsp. cremoris TaxID=1359 RepID=UPI0024A7767E